MKVFVSIPQNSTVMKSFFKGVKEYLEERLEVVYSPLDRMLKAEEIAEYAKDAEVIMIGWEHPFIDCKLLENTSIKLIAHTGGSVGYYVADEVYEKGIKVISGNALFAESVAEGTVGYMLLALRKMPDYVECVKTGGWVLSNDYATEGLLDQTVGLVGFGAVAKNIVKLLKPFRVKFKVYDKFLIEKDVLEEYGVIQVPLEEIFATCKIVSIHCAMNEETKGMIGKEHFELLQDGAVFINTARGHVIREDEMVEVLKEKRIRAVLDVFCEEPLQIDSPLRNMKNVYCIPHKAGCTADRRPMITKCLADDIVRFAEGKDLKHEISRNYAKAMTRHVK